MATLISDQLRWTAEQIVHHLDYGSAVLSGLAPDSRHLSSGGFHCSINDLKAHGNQNDYSNTRADDRGFNPAYGAAYDVSLNKTDMVKAYSRIHAAWLDHSDPRRKYVNAINCWDGTGDATRLDFDANTAKYASPDHTWHIHGEFHRRYVLDAKAARAVVSIFKGEPKATWISREEAPAPKPPVKETDVNLTDKTGNTAYAGRTVQQFINDDWGIRDYLVGDVAGTKVSQVKPGSPLAKLVGMPAQLDTLGKALLAAIAASKGVDVDEDAIAAGVLAGLTPEKIAAWIPEGVAQQVVDLLAARLQA